MYDHIGLKVRDVDAAVRFNCAALAPQGHGLREDYGPKYYAAFLIDPDGNKVEAVCLR